MENDKQSYLQLENEYFKLCETHKLIGEVLALRKGAPGVYIKLLKKQAKIWASKQQHANIVLGEEFAAPINSKHVTDRLDFTNQISSKINVIAAKSLRNKKMFEEGDQKCEEVNRIKDAINKNIVLLKIT